MDFIGWLDFPSDSSAHEKQYVKRNAVDESGFTIKHGNINSIIPRAKLMFPNQFEKKTEISADGNSEFIVYKDYSFKTLEKATFKISFTVVIHSS